MGMAASQARWLALTARKTNVEYEGQQVNQARTALAMKSANTFNELLALKVPTAPSSQDFTKLEYTYQDGNITETIEDMTALVNDPDGYNYLVTHCHYSDIYTGIQNMLVNPQVAMGDNGVKSYIDANLVTKTDDSYTVNGVPVTPYDSTNPEQAAAYDIVVANYPIIGRNKGSLMAFNGTNGVTFALREDLDDAAGELKIDLPTYYPQSNVPKYVGNSNITSLDVKDTTDKAAYDQICRDWPNTDFAKSNPAEIYKWTFQGEVRYACLSDLKKTYDSAPDKTKPTENQSNLMYYVAQDLSTKIENKERAIVDINAEGRIQSIKFENSSATYPVNTNTKTDTQAYEDAMNQYHYDMEVYEKRIADINAKTEKIQEEDRTLELRLRQLDTEQEALQTEMEAVQKVIQKNIESTFKTFES
ncbi:MAG: hypothetical protein VZR09_02830 [Candidatus Gastranaerophilaceae bacterium]|nr:hypothetical protein [Candidatus Gastranaerophilaceae bacterium]